MSVLEVSLLRWALTIGLIVGLLALDLGLAAVRPHAVGFREAAVSSVLYIGVALVFGVVFTAQVGGELAPSTSPATSSRRASRSTTCSSS